MAGPLDSFKRGAGHARKTEHVAEGVEFSAVTPISVGGEGDYRLSQITWPMI